MEDGSSGGRWRYERVVVGGGGTGSVGVVGGRTVWEGKRDGGLAPGGMPMGLCMDHDAVRR